MNKYTVSFFVKNRPQTPSTHFELDFEAETWKEALRQCKATHPEMTDWLLMGPDKDGNFVTVAPYDIGGVGANIVYTGLI